MDFNPIILSIPIFFILIGIELLVERIMNRKLYRIGDAVTNINCGITEQVSHVFMKLFVILIYQLLYEHFALFSIPKNWTTFAILIIAADFCYYWAHRMSHEINLFWAGHVVHHQSEDYNLSVALRQGSFQVVFTFIFNLPLALIGFDTMFFVYTSGFVTLYQFWIHTETIHKMPKFFEMIMNTPSHHRVHHGRNPKYIDKNHAGVFIIWDKLFGTFQPEEETPTYGITTPVQSWNPVYVHFAPFVNIYENMKKVNGMIDKVKILFMPPGWLPEYAGGFQNPKPVSKSTYVKYDAQVNTGLNSYVLVHFVILLAGTSAFLRVQETWSMGDKLLATFSILWSIVNFGLVFELKKWGLFSEIIRLLALPLLTFHFIDTSSLTFVVGTVVVSVISLLWLIRFRNYFSPQRH